MNVYILQSFPYKTCVYLTTISSYYKDKINTFLMMATCDKLVFETHLYGLASN